MLAQISIPVSNVVALLTAGFTRIEMWRTDEYENQYYEVTAPAVASAFMDSADAATTFTMGGRTLKLKVNNGAEQSISFSSLIQNWTPAQVASRINEVVVGLATVVGVAVRLTSPTTGRASSLEITYSDSPNLGFTSGTIVYGKDARITLVAPTVLYTYVDPSGSSGDRYKWRFSANGASPVSDFSAYVEASEPPVSGVPISIGMATFIGVDGRYKKTKLIVATYNSPLVVGAVAVGNDRVQVVESDDLGFLQAPFVVGSVLRISIEGTTYTREITVPNTPTFDILTAMSTAPDPFTVQTTPPFLVRRSI